MVTKSVPNSGRSSLTNTVLTPPAPITETPTFNWRESTSTTMRPLEEDTSQELSLWILSQELWTPSELDLSVNSSDLTTSSSDKPELETTGPRVTTLRELNSLTQSLTSPEKKLKDATASKVSKSPTHWEVELDPEWEPS